MAVKRPAASGSGSVIAPCPGRFRPCHRRDGADGGHDLADDAGIVQEILAEPFAWTVSQGVSLVCIIGRQAVIGLDKPTEIKSSATWRV
jgi:hypothetical protein